MQDQDSDNIVDKFFKHSVDLLCIANTEGCFVRLNPAWEKTLGYTIAELEGKVFLDFVHPDDQEETIAATKQLADNSEVFDFTNRYRHKDGSYRWLKWRSFPHRGAIYASAQDVTQSYKAESLAQITKFSIDLAADSFLWVDENAKIVYANQKACSSLGYSYEELTGGMKVFAIDPDFPEENWEAHKIKMQEKKQLRFESRHITKEGKIFPVEVTTNYFEYNGKFFACAYDRDITERKQYEEALRKQVLALTRPLDDKNPIEITDLFNLNDLQEIQDTFAKATGVASLITHPNGNPITMPSNFTRFCQKIRSTEVGEAKCFESDAMIGKNTPNEYNIQPCLSSGLWNAGAAVIVGGIHVANWLIGQVRNEKLNEEEILKYCDELGLDQKDYVKDYNEVPAMSLKQFEYIANALNVLAGELAIKAYQNVQQARFISAQKDTEKQLIEEKEKAEESKQRYKVLHDASFGGIFIHKNRTILDCNQGLTDITGYSRDELIGMDGLKLIKKEYHDQVINNIRKGDQNSFEVIGIRKNGETYPLRIDARNIPYKDGEVRCVEYRDITEQKKIEAEILKAKDLAEESDRLKTAFLANLSHEIRTPMNGILGFTDLLKNDDIDTQKRSEYIDVIQHSGIRLVKLIDDLIDISQIEANQLTLNNENTNLNDLLETVFNFFEPEAKRNKILYSYEKVLNNSNIVYLDKTKLEQVLINLLHNAFKFTREGTIHLKCTVSGGNIRFCVKDTGEGIAPERQELIFERFRQAEDTYLKGVDGMGLGLSISKSFIEKMGGEISVVSEEGKGSEFTVRLPLIKGREDEKDFEQSGRSLATSFNILIVEDDPVNAQYLIEILQPKSNQLFYADNGKKAQEIYDKHPEIQIILMDLKMPVLNGIDATRAIRKKDKHIPILILTAYTSGKDIENAKNAGCTDFITKPVNQDTLLERIALALERKDTVKNVR